MVTAEQQKFIYIPVGHFEMKNKQLYNKEKN